MKPEHIVGLAVRLFAIVLGLYAIWRGISLIALYQGEQALQGAAVFEVAFSVSLVLVATLLWSFPLIVARRLIPFDSLADSKGREPKAKALEAVAYTVLGLYLLFHVISDSIYWGTIVLIANRNPDLSIEITLEQKAAMVSTAVEFLFVIFLIFGSRRLLEWFHRLRYGESA